MGTILNACKDCAAKINAVFDPVTGTRDPEIIAGDVHTTEQCFVRDEIRFLNTGRLIFDPVSSTETQGEYFREYYVICRKLIVVGGHKPGSFDPCGPDDPGNEYKNNNVITWLDRLHSAPAGPNHGSSAADGQSFGAWQGPGDDGKDGGNGTVGAPGNKGADGKNAPNAFHLVVLEVEMGFGDVLTIDWDGQTGGDGGKGQTGGNGGKGMKGRVGESDTSWPGTGCDRQPGNGGNGGNGGDGGKGGDGGSGGSAGSINVISTQANLTSGPLISGNVVYVYDGATGGNGGKTGTGGKHGLPGKPGQPTSECDEASEGNPGVDGEPAPFSGADPNPGSPGAPGLSGTLNLQKLPVSGTCADLLPFAPKLDPSGVQPSHLCRGFSTPATVEATVTGEHLGQVSSLNTSLANITITKKSSSTDTQLDLKFDLAGNSGLGSGSLILHRDFGPDQTQANAITVERFEVLTITPNTGAKGSSVEVTITGKCFDPGALLHDVIVNGGGVTAQNMLVVDENTVTCTLEIGPLAPSTARDVTVKTGLSQHTLVNSFTVT